MSLILSQSEIKLRTCEILNRPFISFLSIFPERIGSHAFITFSCLATAGLNFFDNFIEAYSGMKMSLQVNGADSTNSCELVKQSFVWKRFHPIVTAE